MKKLQVTLTVEEGKEIIALGLLKHPIFLKAKEKGKITYVPGLCYKLTPQKLAGLSSFLFI